MKKIEPNPNNANTIVETVGSPWTTWMKKIEPNPNNANTIVVTAGSPWTTWMKKIESNLLTLRRIYSIFVKPLTIM
jgi:hypothetical protein